MRVRFEQPEALAHERFIAAFHELARQLGMEWQLHDVAKPARVVVMVSKHGHCLNDLLYRYKIGALPMEIVGIISNHRDFYQLAASYNVPFHHLPVTADSRREAEGKAVEVIDAQKGELVILARYMQILSPEFCKRYEGQIINIHHSFLPSFKGAKPYHQAFKRGVKLIGATAHYVTPDLDEGPIIEQEVARVTHAHKVEDFVAAGRDIESQVLGRAVKAHIERRVLLNGARTVVF